MDSFYHFCSCQEVRPSLKKIPNAAVRRELDALRRNHTQEKRLTVIDMWQCEWWRLSKASNVKQHVRENFPYRHSVTDYQLLERNKGELFAYAQCDIEVLENLRA